MCIHISAIAIASIIPYLGGGGGKGGKKQGGLHDFLDDHFLKVPSWTFYFSVFGINLAPH